MAMNVTDGNKVQVVSKPHKRHLQCVNCMAKSTLYSKIMFTISIHFIV